MALARYVPSSLKGICVRKVVDNIEIHARGIEMQPAEVKDMVLYLLCKRGALNDGNIGKVLHTNVDDLDLSESELSDQGLKEVCRCKVLRKLDLNAGKVSRTRISPEGIKYIAECCHQLEVVFLRRCVNVDDAFVSQLAQRCRNISQLNLDGCNLITDAAVRSLAEYSSKLTSLNISRTQVTDESLKFLSRGRCTESLFELHISFCLNVTDDGIELLLNFCPKLEILIFHGCPFATGRSHEVAELRGGQMKQLSWTVSS